MFDKTSKRPRIDTLGQTSEEEEPERIYRMLKTLGEKKSENRTENAPFKIYIKQRQRSNEANEEKKKNTK